MAGLLRSHGCSVLFVWTDHVHPFSWEACWAHSSSAPDYTVQTVSHVSLAFTPPDRTSVSKGTFAFLGSATVFSKMEHFCVPGPVPSGDKWHSSNHYQRNLSCRLVCVMGDRQAALRGMNREGGHPEFSKGGQKCPTSQGHRC